MHAHGVGAGEAQLDDLGGREDLAQLAVDLVVDGVVVGREQVEELDGQSLLLGQAPMSRGDEAGHVLVGDGVVLAGLHARLALAQLGAADPDELEDARARAGCSCPMRSRAMLVMRICAVL